MPKLILAFILLLLSFNDSSSQRADYNFDHFLQSGNEFYRNGDFAKAITQYELALVLRPSNGKVRNNLRLANDKQELFEENMESSLLIWRKSFVSFFNPKMWFVLFTLFAIGAIYLLYLILIKNQISSRRKLALAAMVGLSLLFLASNQFRSNDLFENPYYISEKAQNVYTGADDRSEVILEIPAGTKVKKTDKIKDWIKVKIGFTHEGWVKEEDLKGLFLIK